MTGPACTVMITHDSSRSPTGTASENRNCGGATLPAAQKIRTPERSKAMSAARPDNNMSAISIQAVGAGAAALAPGLRSAWNNPNLATKPESGGKPAMISAQAANDIPRNASAAGMLTPTGSSGVSST